MYLQKNILGKIAFYKCFRSRVKQDLFTGVFQVIVLQFCEQFFRRLFARGSHSEIFHKKGVPV